MSDTPENTPPPPASGFQVPVRKRALWGLGGATDAMMYQGVNILVDPIMNMGMGVDSRILGLARSLPRFADILLDPLIGHLSDNTRSRWGRRKPWMLVGVLMATLIAIFMWHVPGNPADYVAPAKDASIMQVFMASAWRNSFVVGMLVLFFTFAYSLFTIPYNGQGYEMTTDYNERTHLFAWRQYAYAATGFVIPWLPNLCIKTDILVFGAEKKTASGLHAIPWIGLILGVLILATAIGPIFFTGEGKTKHTGEEKVSFVTAAGQTLRNKAFWPLVITNFLIKFGGIATGGFFMYVIIYYMCGGSKDAGTAFCAIFFNSINIATIIAMAPMVKLTDKLGKKPMLIVLLVASAVAYASVWFTLRPYGAMPTAPADGAGFLGWLTQMAQLAAWGWPALITGAGIGIFCNFQPLLINSMLADVCDVDELKSGHQRQAFYGAVFVTCDKIAMGVGMLLSGYLLAWSGFLSDQVEQSATTIGYWTHALLYTQPTGFVLGVLVILAYPITRATATEVRRQLDERQANRSNQP